MRGATRSVTASIDEASPSISAAMSSPSNASCAWAGSSASTHSTTPARSVAASRVIDVPSCPAPWSRPRPAYGPVNAIVARSPSAIPEIGMTSSGAMSARSAGPSTPGVAASEQSMSALSVTFAFSSRRQ